jgi:hypothetical protein
MPAKNTEGEVRPSTRLRRASNWRDRLWRSAASSRRPEPVLQARPASGSRCTRRGRTSFRMERRSGTARQGLVEQDRAGPALPGTQHVAKGKPAAGGKALENFPALAAAARSLMWTSTASKPAAMKARAISRWPLTPCSRRMATRGRRWDESAGTSAGSKLRRGTRPGRSSQPATRMLLVGALRVVAQTLHPVTGLGPGLKQFGQGRIH